MTALSGAIADASRRGVDPGIILALEDWKYRGLAIGVDSDRIGPRGWVALAGWLGRTITATDGAVIFCSLADAARMVSVMGPDGLLRIRGWRLYTLH